MKDFTQVAEKTIPGILITVDTVYINGKLIFSSNDRQSIQTFLFGLLVGNTLKN